MKTNSAAFTFKNSLAVLLLISSLAQADVVTDWNQSALQAIKIDRTPPPRAARNLAIVHLAIYDAVNGVLRTHEPYISRHKAPGGGHASPEAAAAAAGRIALIGLYPAQQATFNSASASLLAGIPEGKAKTAGIAWGEKVANDLLAQRADDGSNAVVSYVPGTNPGDWQPTPPAYAPVVLPQWPNVRPFALISAGRFRPPPPPGLSHAVYAFDFNLTKQLGAASSSVRTADQTAIAFFWADGVGTVTPPGHWNSIAGDVATQRGNSMAQNARLFALLNMAMADAGIAAWDCKYIDNFWRPITAIRAADTDGNAATEADPAWTPLLVTPPFPEYVSGHSTFSAAAATILGTFFGDDNLPFTTVSDDLPGVVRSFDSFWDAAAEAGLSRIFGGIHFMAANQQGLTIGTRIGANVSENFLLEAKH